MLLGRIPVVILGLSVIIISGASANDDYPPNRHGLIANFIIKSQQPFIWLAQHIIYPGMSLKTVTLGEEEYSYLIRQGERKGAVILLHGTGGRKEWLMPLVYYWSKLKKPLPTIIAVDLLGHGDLNYPVNYDFSVENFTRHAARFVRYIQQNNNEPLIIVGHSLGGTIALLLKSLENISASATISISPAGLGLANITDLKARIEAAEGLPFDFGSADVCQLIEMCVEEYGSLVSSILNFGCIVYSYLSSPYENWVKNRMYAQLAKSESQFFSRKTALQVIAEHHSQPVYIIWARSDRLLDKSRFLAVGDYLSHSNQGEGIEIEGAHAWPMEHPDRAAKLVDSFIEHLGPVSK